MAKATPSAILPTDEFSRELRSANDTPGVLTPHSTIDTIAWYGNAAPWVVVTARDESGDDLVFLQRVDAAGGQRLVLPRKVTEALSRHRDQLGARATRRQGHNLAALRKQRGDKLGNPEALRAARVKRAALKAVPR